MNILDMLFGGSNSSSSGSTGGTGFNQGMNVGANMGGNFNTAQGGSIGFQNAQNEGQSTSSGGSFSSSSSRGSSSSTQDIWGAQSPFLKQVYESAAQGNTDAQAAIQAMQPGIQNQVNNLAAGGQQGFNQMLAGGAAAGLGPSMVGGMQGNSLQQQMLNNYNGQNPYLSGMKDQIAQDANRLKQQNLGNLDARAAAAGMSGSSGYRQQVADMAENVDDQALNAMTNLGYQANTQAIQDQMALSGAADQFNMNAAGAADQYGMQQAGMMDQNVMNAMGQTNAMQQSALNQFNPTMAGLNATGAFANIIGGPTTLTQSESQNTSSSTGGSSQESQSTNSGFSNGINLGFNNAFGMGMNMGGNYGFNNGYNSNYGNNNSVGNSTTGVIPGVAAGVAAAKA